MKLTIFLCNRHYEAFLRSFIDKAPEMKVHPNPRWGNHMTYDCEASTVLDVECTNPADWSIRLDVNKLQKHSPALSE